MTVQLYDIVHMCTYALYMQTCVHVQHTSTEGFCTARDREGEYHHHQCACPGYHVALHAMTSRAKAHTKNRIFVATSLAPGLVAASPV